MTTKIYYLTLFSIALIIFRLIPHPPNFSPIIASAIVAPFIINSRLYGALLPIIAMFNVFFVFNTNYFCSYFW